MKRLIPEKTTIVTTPGRCNASAASPVRYARIPIHPTKRMYLDFVAVELNVNLAFKKKLTVTAMQKETKFATAWVVCIP